tara:strand:+ start:898 stop:1821 length:924 start_codon:yes stop_codon:yes gene_type:complete
MSFNFKVDLLTELDNQLVSKKDVGRLYRSPRDKPHLWPTESSVQWEASNGLVITEGSCSRAVWYRINGFPVTDEPIPRMHWVWKAGQDWEDHCNQLSADRGILAAKSIKIQDTSLPLTISGEIDGVNFYLDSENIKHFYVIDYKSTGGSYYNTVKLMGNSRHNPFPKVENLLQLMVYLHRDPRLEFGMLVYLIRDKMDRTQFEIELITDDDGLVFARVNGKNYPKYSVNEIYRRYARICDYYDREELPPRDYDFEYTDSKAKMLHDVGELSKSALQKHLSGKAKDRQGHWRCSYCNFRQQCELDGET